MGNGKRDCFGIFYDEGCDECRECMVRKECKVIFIKMGLQKLETLTEEDFEKEAGCFGQLYDANDENCRICIMSDFCQQIFERVKEGKMENENTRKEDRMEEERMIENGGENKEQVAPRGDEWLSKDYRVLRNARVGKKYVERYKETGNPWSGCKVKQNELFSKAKNPWKEGAKKYKIFEEMKRLKEFAPEDLEKVVDSKKMIKNLLRECIMVGLVVRDDAKSKFVLQM